MHADDDANNKAALGERAEAFASLKTEVMTQWRVQVTASIPETNELKEPVLLNSLPVFFDNIVESLSPTYPRSFATEGTNVANAHGRERAIETNYTPSDVVRELHLLKRVFLEVAFNHGIQLVHPEFLNLDESINRAIAEAIEGFTRMHRERFNTFVTGLSHDLRNPIQVAFSAAQLIQLKSVELHVVELGQRVCRKLRDADGMIESLLDATMQTSRTLFDLHISEFDMLELAHQLAADFPRNPVLIEGGSAVGFWSRDHMKRALENLLSNAQNYGLSGHDIKVRLVEEDGRLLLSVHNEGEPIPKERQSEIFKPHQRLSDSKIKGWGLGLSSVQTIVESHGGSIIVDSAADRGTTFIIDVPIDCRTPAERANS